MKTSVGKTKLELASGDITQLEVDAIVAPPARSCGWTTASPRPSSAPAATPSRRRPCCRGPCSRRSRRHHGPRPQGALGRPRRAHEAGPTADAGARHGRHACRAGRRRARPRPLRRPSGFRHRRLRFPLYQCSSLMVAEVVAYLRDHPHGPAPRDAVRLRRRGEGGVQERHGRHQPLLAAAGVGPADGPRRTRRMHGRHRAGARPPAHHRRHRRRGGEACRRAVHHRARPRRAGPRPGHALRRAAPVHRPRLLRLPADPALRGGVQPRGHAAPRPVAAHRGAGGARRVRRLRPHRPRGAPAGRTRLVGGAALRRAHRRHRPGERRLAVPQARRIGASDHAGRRREPVQRRRGRGALRRRRRGSRRRPRRLAGWAVGRSSGCRSAAPPSASPSATAPPGSTAASTTTSSRSRSRPSSPTGRSCSPSRSACPASSPA